ncbi:acetyltransferase [Aaosphaeria arxii CBS 175.79]|uniref:Acetyltransferase n=1 Tax=Aaosphaeria arxii CBS 175.79 TaxID=1450172 RepID=A0A6A5Y1Y3_9PLEO|nr:acetyltransferase [Aaosphaeria arxii CBS 175.79]KAF2019246.1 acetyltransferase [Aaosphaeria arxii CBS 175.79]
MPRDLESAKATLEAMPPLSKAKEQSNSPPADDPMPLYRVPTMLIEDRFKRMRDLNPYSLLLTQDDLDDCDWLEHAAFDPIEAATREKLDYRLHVAGSLCTGLFTSAYRTSPAPLGNLIRSRTFPSADSNASDRKRILLAHIIATKHPSPLVTDPSMAYPSDWRTNRHLNPPSGEGHHEDGETVCLHSLCVHPEFQNKGLARVLLVSWVQKMKDAGVAKRVALLCRERLVGWYQKAGFTRVGESRCQYGGGGWVDMVVEFGELGGGSDDNDF